MTRQSLGKSQPTFRAGVDIGGTFTDIVLMGDDGSIKTKKVSSTPDDYSRGIVQGLHEALGEIDAQSGSVDGVVHATTVATNAVLESKGAKIALVTTRGFRDVLEIRRLRIAVMYDPSYVRPPPLVPRRLRFEVTERIGANGQVRMPLDEQSVAEVAKQLIEARVEAVAICLLHAYANPAHEQRVRELLVEALPPEIYVSCSHEILPEIGEYERTSTVVVNAYLGPVVSRYLTSLTKQLNEMGIRRPLQIMQSNGGLMSAQSTIAKPVAILESGPAAGVIAAARLARKAGVTHLITLDVGGTTAKTAIVEEGEPAKTTEFEVGAGINTASRLSNGGGYAIKLPVIDISEIGAGGGSQISIDVAGCLHVGPQSAGAVPGPVCYGTGGTRATLTDALVTLGYINPHHLAGGGLQIEVSRARRAIEEQVAKPLGLPLLEAAYGVYKIAGSNMVGAVKSVSTHRGRDPRPYTLVAFGGNGPTLSLEIARSLEIAHVLVPPNPGVFSAYGLLLSDVEHEVHRTLLGRLDQLSLADVERTYGELESAVRAQLEGEGYRAEGITILRHADLRYAGQAFELTVPLDARHDGGIDVAVLSAAFHVEHERAYGHKRESDPVELVNVRVTARVPAGSTDAAEESKSTAWRVEQRATPEKRMAYFGPGVGSVETPVLERQALVGRTLSGPLIVEEYDSTCAIPPGFRATVDRMNNIRISMEEGQ